MLSLSRNSPFHRPCESHISSSSQSHHVPISHTCSAAPPSSQSILLRPIVTIKVPSLDSLGTHFHFRAAQTFCLAQAPPAGHGFSWAQRSVSARHTEPQPFPGSPRVREGPKSLFEHMRETTSDGEERLMSTITATCIFFYNINCPTVT